MNHRIIALFLLAVSACAGTDADTSVDAVRTPDVRAEDHGERSMPDAASSEPATDTVATAPETPEGEDVTEPTDVPTTSDDPTMDPPEDPAPVDDRLRVALYHDTDAVFGSEDDAVAVMTANDAYLSHVGPFDRSAMSGVEGDVSALEFETHLASQAAAWAPDETARITASIDRVRPDLEQLHLPLPDEVLFVRVDDPFGRPYTRGTSVVIPGSMFAEVSDDQLDELVIHELFHVMSRHAPDLRDDLYDVIAFTPCGELEWPPELADYRITNPDAPVLEHYTTINVGGYLYDVMPITYASSPYDSANTNVFDYMQFYLLIVDTSGPMAVPARDQQGQLMAFQGQQTQAYFENVGGNTQYVIHPEEVLADNFVFAVQGASQLPNPEIPAQMLERLQP